MFKFFKKDNQLNESKDNNQPAHIEGMTLVDAYYIDDAQVEDYKKDRVRYCDAIIYVLGQYFASVETMFEGSEDGEAVVAFQDDQPVKCIYLNPETIDQLRIDEAQIPLKQAILKLCNIEDESNE
ncbi:hypothetical protein [Mammaliicoccus sp. Dog046]|uniref:hypothetical protein n=1 Tax=Mammaliicoccus sp. Dog046 TaxID=3034233 RepID=UPI002B256E32|nr:hypothetical protein [Mammaliicoccus sp. Dog046]WQK85932.1 hypothetical protein P3U32_02560 [Mammaliicoccus sp. Dog046]